MVSSAARILGMCPATPPLSLEKPVHAEGKQRLIEAALKFCAREGITLSSLGLRELAREAELNHNTFYRHFGGLEELAQAAAEEVARQLMTGLRDVRQRAQKHVDATRGSVEYFLAFVLEHPAPFIVGLRETHSLHSPMRSVLQQVLAQIAQESADQITELDLVPGVDRPSLVQATSAITYHMFYRALDVIEQPARRRQIGEQIVYFIRTVFLGAVQARTSAA